MKNLSRNTPVAFVVGVAGFLGSHLSEKLLEKNIQVVGVDNLSTGRLENLAESSRDRNFSFINQQADRDLPVVFPRLDYAFFILPEKLSADEYFAGLRNFLKICREHRSKIVFVSSIDLYDAKAGGLHNLRRGEGETAKFAAEEGLNARVVRLAAVYGPRMVLQGDDPIIRILESSCRGELQKEITALDFSTRALYIDDAVNLLIKTVMHGATAQKIYDGVGTPVKVSEIKQILLDPLWHENRQFTPTELPPWPTPNLQKTEKELSWKTKASVIGALKETLAYFRENPECLVKPEREPEPIQEEKKQAVAELFGRTKVGEVTKEGRGKEKKGRRWQSPFTKARLDQAKIFLGTMAGLILIGYGLVYPILSVGAGVYSVEMYLRQSGEAIRKGDFAAAQAKAESARLSSIEVDKSFGIFTPLTSIGFLGGRIKPLGELLKVIDQASGAGISLAKGAEGLAESLQVISGEQEGELKKVLSSAYAEFDRAEKDLSLVEGRLKEKEWNTLPKIVIDRISGLRGEIEAGKELAEGGRAAVFLLSQTIASGNEKRYLVLVQDNTVLRPGGGLLSAFGEISFKEGRLEAIQTGTIKSLDEKLTERVRPPAEVETDLKESAWLLRDSNQEADFPANARTALWFYEQEGGTKADGVVVLDLTSLAKILKAVGSVSLSSSSKTVSDSSLIEEVGRSAEREKFVADVLKEVLNRIFFLPGKNWVSVGEVLGRSLAEKHAMIYLADAKLLPFLKDNRWAGALPPPEAETAGERREFFAATESSLTASGQNLNLNRSYLLEDALDKNGVVSHKLGISYANPDSQSYRFRLRVYLNSGTKVEKALWGKEDLTSKVSAFSDYGRAGYSVLLELKPQEQNSFRLEYRDVKPLQLKDGQVLYQLDIIKQAGTLEDKFEYRLNLPESFKTGGERTVSTTLSEDRSFEFKLQKGAP